jgi:hypothetical protein
MLVAEDVPLSEVVENVPVFVFQRASHRKRRHQPFLEDLSQTRILEGESGGRDFRDAA